MFQQKRVVRKLKPLNLALLITLAGGVHAGTELDTVKVQDGSLQSQSNMLQVKDDTIHTETITAKKIEQKQAATLSEAIADEPGVRVSTECSMCGVKRIMRALHEIINRQNWLKFS